MRHWLHNDRVADPVERQQAALLQILLAVMVLAVALAMALNVAVFGWVALTPAGALPNLLLLVALAGALLLLRRGHFRPTVALLVAALLAGQAYTLLAEGFAGHAAQLLVFVVPIALAGMFLRRRGLLATIGLSLLIVVAAALIERARGLPAAPAPPLAATIVLFLLVVGVLGLFLDRFSGTLRRALAEATRLARENDQLYREAQAQRAQFQATLASLGDAVIATDPAGQITFMNHLAESLTGWQLAEAGGRPLREILSIVDEAARAPVESPVDLVLRTGAVAGLANHSLLLARDGRAIPIDDSGAPIRDGEGRLLGVVLVFRDISERRAAERALSASEQRYRLLTDAMPQISWMMRPTGELEYLNQRWADYTGTSVELRHDGRWLELIHPDDRARLMASRTAALASGDGYEQTLRLRRAGAGYRWNLVRVVPLRDERGILTWFGTATDIDDLKQAEAGQRFLTDASKQLAASLDLEATLQTIMRLAVPQLASWCAVLLHDDEQAAYALAIEYADPSQAPRVRSWRLRAALTHEALALGADMPAPPRAIPAELLAGEPGLAEIYQALGQRPAMRAPLVARNRLLGSLELIGDAADRAPAAGDRALVDELARRAATALDNAQLYQAAQQASAVRDQFLSIASHELKTPLTAMLGYTRLLQRRNERERFLADRDVRAVSAIESQGRRLESLINLLLDLSRIETGHLLLDLVPLDLGELVRRLLDEIQPTAERHTLTLQAAEQPLMVLADPLRLEQVVLNLVQNAIKYSPFGGTVEVRVAQDGDLACFEVADQGIGIAADALPRLFSRFYRAPNASELHISGTGIGLYVVREIVTRHGGTVEAASEERVGSTFTVRLPLAPA